MRQTKPVERLFVCRMFDIVSGRETRAAVLLAGFHWSQASEPYATYDGLRFSMESQFMALSGRKVGWQNERASRQIYANALQRSIHYGWGTSESNLNLRV